MRNSGNHKKTDAKISSPASDELSEDFQKILYNRYRNIISHINTCVVIYQVRNNGKEFIFADFNRAAEKAEKINKEELIGKEVREVFPGVEEFGLLRVFKEVYNTGKPMRHPVTLYKDNRITGWRENCIYKLPGGELLVTYEDRTEEKIVEEKLKESEQRYRELADMLPEVIFETNAEGTITYANKMTLSIFRYNREDLVNHLPVKNLLIPEYHLRARREVYRQIRGKKSSSPEEFTALRKDGTTFPAQFRVSPIIKNNQFRGLRGILYDLTSQKKIREQLKRDKTFLEQLIQRAPEAIVQTFKDGTILKVNKEFTKLFGYKEEEVLGLPIDEIISGNDPKVLKEVRKLSDRTARGNFLNVETTRYKKDGTPVPVSILGTPIFLENHIIGVYGIYRDISERKRNEKITEVILNISTAALISDIQQGFFKAIRKELGKIINVKNLFIALYHKDTDTLYFPLYKDEKDNFKKKEFPAEGSITKYTILKGKPVFLKRKDFKELEKKGEFRIVGTQSKVWIGVPLKVNNEIIGVISIQDYEDEHALSRNDLRILEIISNQIALAINHIHVEEILRSAKESAEENAGFKEQFLSTMSHEIRTPLNAIIGMSRLLGDTNPTENQMEYIKALKVSGENLLRLINDILDFSKLEAGRMVIENIKLNPADQVKGLVQTYYFSAQAKDIALQLDIDPDLPEQVMGDPTRINQVLTNLIGNAIKFTQAGSVTVSLHRIKEDDKTIDLKYAVSDTGIGISKEKLKDIFESFSQAERSTTRKFGGTGLGLAISKNIARLLGSDIQVESELGKGTTFSFILHLAKSENPISENKKKNYFPEMLKGKRALIAEDNALNRMVADHSMKEWGMLVDQAENGEEAVKMVRQTDYDVILMDLQMPVMDGYEASRIIRNLPDKKKSRIPIIALTASALLDVKTQVYQYKMDDVLMKPFRPKQLFHMIARLIFTEKEEEE